MIRLFWWSVAFYAVTATMWVWFGAVAGLLTACAIIYGTLMQIRAELRETGDPEL